MKSLKIQIVDDDRDFAEGISDILRSNGHATVLARNGEEAISQKEHEAFDLTLMDIRMPGLNGVETYHCFKAIDLKSNVYMMTGFAVEELREAALAEGALGILDKPLDIDKLLKIVARLAGRALVLIVDDDRDFVESLKDILHAEGYPVDTAFSGTEAIEKIEANGFKAVVLDLRMAEVSGLDVFRCMQELDMHVPTIIVTAYLVEERGSLDAVPLDQFEAVFSKPIDPDRFLAVLEKIDAES